VDSRANGSVSFGNSSSFNLELGGTTPGTDHDQLDIAGTVAIGSTVTLNTSAYGGYTPSGGDTYLIIANDGSDAVSGTFDGLAEGAMIPNFLGSGLDAQISYAGGDGNDVVITTSIGIPEIDMQRPTTTSIADAGTDALGNQAPSTVHLTYTVDNSVGTEQLTITAVTADNLVNASNFTVVTDMPLDIAAGGAKALNISFDVDALGAFSLDMHIDSNDDDENPYDITITGTGAAVPEMDVLGNDTSIFSGDTTPDPADHTDFGNADENGATITRTFTIKNTGLATLDLTGGPPLITLTGSADFTLTSDAALAIIPADGETSFTVTFDPSAQSTETATVTIDNNDSDEHPYTFDIQGTGTGPAPEMDVLGSPSIPDGDTSPSALEHTDFGFVLVDGGAVTYTYIIRNTGSLDLNLGGTPTVSISGAHAAEFSVNTQPVALIPAGGGEATFEITFDPRGGGLRTATVSIVNDDNDEDPYDFNIQGTGTVPAEGGDDGAEQPQELLAGVGVNGGVFRFGRVIVTVPKGTLTDHSDCQISISNVNGEKGLSQDDPIYDVSITCADGQPVSYNPPLEICLKPTPDQIGAAGSIFANLRLFHSHAGQSWNPLYETFEQDGYLCVDIWQLSFFTIHVPEIPATGFAPGVVVALPEKSEGKEYNYNLSVIASASEAIAPLNDGRSLRPDGARDDNTFVLSIPALELELPIVGVPLTGEGWDVSWLGEAAGYLEGTAYPTRAGNTAITAHVWDADNTPGPFVDLHTLQHGDEIIIHAWGQDHVYEVRALTEVRPNDLSALPHSEYDVLTLITCQGYDESSGEYTWRLAVRAVLISMNSDQ